jgi:hypothetical protein
MSYLGCSIRLYLQFIVGELMSYLGCSVRFYLQFIVGGFMSYLRYLCLFGSSLPPFYCRRAHVLFTLFVFVRFVFTSSLL